MGDVRRNCWTCAHNDPGARACNVVGWALSAEVEAWEARQTLTSEDGHYMPPKDAPPCPGWKPTPKQENTDRAQVAGLATDSATIRPPFGQIRPDSATRSEWDALLARIAEIERVGAKNARDLARLRRKR